MSQIGVLRRVDGFRRTGGAGAELHASVRHANAQSGVACSRLAVGSALVLPNLFASERLSPSARERVTRRIPDTAAFAMSELLLTLARYSPAATENPSKLAVQTLSSAMEASLFCTTAGRTRSSGLIRPSEESECLFVCRCLPRVDRLSRSREVLPRIGPTGRHRFGRAKASASRKRTSGISAPGAANSARSVTKDAAVRLPTHADATARARRKLMLA